MADETIRIDTRIDTDSAERDLDELKKKLKDTSTEGKKGFNEASQSLYVADKSTRGLTSSMSALGKVLSGISAAAIAKKLGDGIRDIYETTEEAYASIRKASTLFGDVAVNQQNLIGKLSSIAAETGSSISELGEAMYQAMSAGVAPTEDMADVLDVVTKSAKLAKGGFTETSKAMSASLSVINSYKMNVSDLDKVQGILLQTQNKGVTTVDELGSALSKVTPAAAAFGVSFEQVSSALALMTKQGTSTDVAATALATTLSELGKSGTTASKNLKEAADAAGLSEDTFSGLISEGYNLSEILTLMSEYAEQNGLSMVDMFGSIEAGRATLQLSGSNLEDFNEILASMGETAGLVQDSFDKVISPTQRLESAWLSFKTKIGQEIKPVIDGLAGALGDVLEKMTGQGEYGPILETTLKNIKTSSDELKKSQEEVGGAIEATTLAMQFQTKMDFWSSISKASSQYNAMVKQYSSLTKQQKEVGKTVEGNMKILQEAASQTGRTVDEVLTVLAQAATNRKVDASRILQVDNLPDLMEAAEVLGDNNQKLKDIEAQSESTRKAITDFENSLAEMVMKGVISLSDISLINTTLATNVGNAIVELEKEKTVASDTAKAVENLASATGNAGTAVANVGTAVGTQDETLSEYIRKFGQINEEFNSLRNAGKLLGESLYSPQDELETLKNLYVSWIKDVGQGSPVLVSLKKRIEELGGVVDDLNASLEAEGFKASLDETISKFEKLSQASSVLGDEYYSMESYLKDLESLYAGALVEGIDASSDAMKNLADEIERIKGIIEKADDATVDWKGTWDDFRKQGYASLLKDISSAFDEIFQKESNLIKLEEELSDLSKEEYDNKEAIKTAQSDLDDAIARGNQSAIDNANEKLRKAKETLKTTQSTIEAVNKEKKAVEDGSSVWKAFGNSAMQSMASVLESLGSSLAAQAAAALIGMNWGGAALATAGSLAAYAAASWARSQKFASGGIVGGTSYSGDNVIARVNSGELILNMAQQDNVAKALSTLADMSGLGTSGGAGVNVYLSGASFYGLDEPAVGKAIYDNIQQLHYEGVI